MTQSSQIFLQIALWLGIFLGAAPPWLAAQNVGAFPNVRFIGTEDGRRIEVDVGPPTPETHRRIVVELSNATPPPAAPDCGSAEQDRRLRARSAVVTAFVRQWLSQALQVDLIDTVWGPLYDLRARVLFDGQDLGRELIARGLARPAGGSDGDWCE